MMKLLACLTCLALAPAPALAADVPAPASSLPVLQTVTDRFTIAAPLADPVLTTTITYQGALADAMRKHYAGVTPAQLQEELFRPWIPSEGGADFKSPPVLEDLRAQNTLRVTQEVIYKQFWRVGNQDHLYHRVPLWALFQVPGEQNTRKASPTAAVAVMPGIYRHQITVDAASGTLIAPPTKEIRHQTPGFAVLGKTSFSPNRLDWQVELHLRQVRDAAVANAGWVNELKQVQYGLFAVVAMHALDQAKRDSLAKAVKELPEYKQSVPFQDVARQDILYQEAMLESDKNTPTLRSRILQANAASLVSLGLFDAAATRLNDALEVTEKDEAGLFYLVALTAFAKQQDPLAREYVTKALQLAPKDGNSLYLKMVLDYVSGNYAAVAEYADAGFKANNRNEMLAMWRYLAQRQLGQDGKAGLKEAQATLSRKGWAYPMSQYCLGEGQLSSAFNNMLKEDDSHYYVEKFELNLGMATGSTLFAGEKLMLDGETRKARGYWQNTVNSQWATALEYSLAKRRLASMDSGKPAK